MISIIDYGVGNLRSVEKAFNYIGCEAAVSSDREFILNSDGVVLPGVGAFAEAMDRLRDAGMVEVVKEAVAAKKPFLGICLGLQLLFDRSEEGGENVEGLGILKGEVRQFPLNAGLKVPHMGWNTLAFQTDCPLFKNLSPNPYVYFVHSFYLRAEDQDVVSATARYGTEFHAAVWSGNIYATQFHPEKSGSVGLQILKNFAAAIK